MIGDIIEELRLLKNMSRKALCEGICTEKYVYLIEKNQRNPSVYILKQFSERMGVDLFKYYEFSSYKNKILVSEHKRKFVKYMRLGDVEKLKEESLKASRIEDFKHEPLRYDIVIIDLLYSAIVKDETSRAIKKLNHILKRKNLIIDTTTLVAGYVVLCICYQIEANLDKAQQVIEIAYNLIKDKMELARYRVVIIAVFLSIISLLYRSKEYNQLIKYSYKLMAFQKNMVHMTGFIVYIFIFLLVITE